MITMDYIEDNLVKALIFNQIELEINLVGSKHALEILRNKGRAVNDHDYEFLKEQISEIEAKLAYIQRRLESFLPHDNRT